MEIVDVKEIDILRHLTDEDLDNIKFVHVYGSGRPGGELSALYITKNDQAFLTGYDSLFGVASLTESEQLLGQSHKVEELSGLGVEKIVVCAEFGAALTVDNELYLWGSDVAGGVTNVNKYAIQCHYDGYLCPDCSQQLASIWGGCLSWCITCRKLQNAVSPLPHTWVDWAGPVRIGLCYHATDLRPQVMDVFCTKCGKHWVECGIAIELKDLRLMFCMTCADMIDGEWYKFIPPQTNQVPHKVNFEKNLLVNDISAGTNFLLVQTPSQLFIWGEIGGFRHNDLFTPDYVTIVKMSCGSSHIALVSLEGDLYIYGDTGRADNPTSVTLPAMRKISLKAPAVDVACGPNSVVCLLENGTFEFIGDVAEMVPGGVWTNELSVISIPKVANQKTIESTVKHLLQPDRKQLTILTGDNSNVFMYLHSLGDETQNGRKRPLRTDATIQTELESNDKGTSTDLESRPSDTIGRDLFGKTFLSDLTIKLSDGIVPVHRMILFHRSVFFRLLFTDLGDLSLPGVLDMSSHNGAAYRSLLKYFYRVPVGELSCKDLFDLYVLASSYNEDWVTKDVLARIKNSLDDDNVLFFHNEAGTVNATELRNECLAYMNSH